MILLSTNVGCTFVCASEASVAVLLDVVTLTPVTLADPVLAHPFPLLTELLYLS